MLWFTSCGKIKTDQRTVSASDLFFFSDPLLSLLQEGALGITSSHDGGTPAPLQVGPYVLLLNPKSLLQTHLGMY